MIDAFIPVLVIVSIVFILGCVSFLFTLCLKVVAFVLDENKTKICNWLFIFVLIWGLLFMFYMSYDVII